MGVLYFPFGKSKSKDSEAKKDTEISDDWMLVDEEEEVWVHLGKVPPTPTGGRAGKLPNEQPNTQPNNAEKNNAEKDNAEKNNAEKNNAEEYIPEQYIPRSLQERNAKKMEMMHAMIVKRGKEMEHADLLHKRMAGRLNNRIQAIAREKQANQKVNNTSTGSEAKSPSNGKQDPETYWGGW